MQNDKMYTGEILPVSGEIQIFSDSFINNKQMLSIIVIKWLSGGKGWKLWRAREKMHQMEKKKVSVHQKANCHGAGCSYGGDVRNLFL